MAQIDSELKVMAQRMRQRVESHGIENETVSEKVLEKQGAL